MSSYGFIVVFLRRNSEFRGNSRTRDAVQAPVCARVEHNSAAAVMCLHTPRTRDAVFRLQRDAIGARYHRRPTQRRSAIQSTRFPWLADREFRVIPCRPAVFRRSNNA